MDVLFTNQTRMTAEAASEYAGINDHVFHTGRRALSLIGFMLALAALIVCLSGAGRIHTLYGAAMFSALIAAGFLALFFFGYRLFRNRLSGNESGMYGNVPYYSYCFTDAEIQHSAINRQEVYPYAEVTGIAETKSLILLFLGRKSIALEKAGFQGTTADEFRTFLAGKCPKATVFTRPKLAADSARVVFGAFFMTLPILLLFAQAVYLIVLKKHGFEYISETIPYLLNGILLLSAFVGTLFFFLRKKTVMITTSAVLFVLSVLNIIWLIGLSGTVRSIIRISPDYRHVFVMKQDAGTGKAVVYQDIGLLFAKPKDQLPYTALQIKTQWLTGDVCAVTYRQPNNTVHQYVATYGDRGGGASYHYVEAALSGKWVLTGGDTTGKSITVGDGVTIIQGDTQEKYETADCVQAGTTALILCKSGLPEWTIALNENCKIGNDDLIAPGGTITLCPVSMGATAPLNFMNVGHGSAAISSSTKSPSNAGSAGSSKTRQSSSASASVNVPDSIRTLQIMLSQSPTLSDFTSRQDIVKVTSDSSDLFTVGRLTLEENLKQYAVNGYDQDVQIDQMRVMAGDINEFLIEIKSTQTASNGSESQTTGFDQEFRIRKGEGVYLGMRIPYGIDGTVGLKKRSTPSTVDTSSNPDDHFKVPAAGTGK